MSATVLLTSSHLPDTLSHEVSSYAHPAHSHTYSSPSFPFSFEPESVSPSSSSSSSSSSSATASQKDHFRDCTPESMSSPSSDSNYDSPEGKMTAAATKVVKKPRKTKTVDEKVERKLKVLSSFQNLVKL